MKTEVEKLVHKEETILFVISLIISFLLYFYIFNLIITTFGSNNPAMRSIIFYAIVFILYFFFRFGILIGHIKGNAVKLSQEQFPIIYSIVEKQSLMLGLKTVPTVYILQSGGILNAFAAKFFGRNYIVLYSEIVESSLEKDINILEFIVGHELGHIKRNHMMKKLLLFPSRLVPFLGSAYSRACEYTCDNIGNELSPKGTINGLLILASGSRLYKSVNIKEYILQENKDDGFWIWFAEIVSSHPHLTKRISKFKNQITVKPINNDPIIKEEEHNRYMPN